MNMKIFNANRQKNMEVNNLLQRIKYEVNEQGGARAYFPLYVGYKMKQSPSTQILFKKLKKMGVIDFSERTCAEANKTLKENPQSIVSEGYFVTPIEPQFSRLCEEYEKKTDIQSNKLTSKSETIEQVNEEVPLGNKICYRNLEVTMVDNRARNVKNNGNSLSVSKNGLRNEDLLVIASLIMAKGAQMASGSLIEKMGVEDNYGNNAKLYRSINRLRRFGKIDIIKNKKGEGYYLA